MYETSLKGKHFSRSVHLISDQLLSFLDTNIRYNFFLQGLTEVNQVHLLLCHPKAVYRQIFINLKLNFHLLASVC